MCVHYALLYSWNNCIFQDDDDATQIGDDLDEWMQVHCRYKLNFMANIFFGLKFFM